LRSLFGYIILLYVLFWLVFSYLPESFISLPEIDFPRGWTSTNFPILFVICAIVFLLIQIWLVIATNGFFKGKRYLYSQDKNKQIENIVEAEGESILSFRLSRPQELFWTALPILMTILVLMAVNADTGISNWRPLF